MLLYWVGVTPVIFLNARLKEFMAEKPLWKAMSETGSDVSFISRLFAA